MRLAQSVKVDVALMRAVAAMYNHVHVSYFEQGLDLLHEMSRAGTDVMRAARQRALESYCRRVQTEVEGYVERVSIPVFAGGRWGWGLTGGVEKNSHIGGC